MIQEVDNYAGSRLFETLAAYIGLPVDQTNFVISQLVALLLAAVYRTVLHPSRTTPAVRHAFGMVCGLLIAYFCFGYQALHLAGLPAICYVIIITQNPHIMHGMVLMVSLIYVSCLHLHRQVYDYASYGLDVSGPLMVMMQKMTSLAFSLHDGLTKKDEEMTKSQKYFAVYRKPSFLEFFSYSLLFPCIMAGPLIFYNDYIEFIEGKCYNKYNSPKDPTSIMINEPSPARAVVKKLILAVICAMVFVQFLPKFPIKRVKDEHFLKNTSFSYKFWYLTVSTTLVRFKYYFAWIMADAICNNGGLGFAGYKENGEGTWDGISNVDVFKFELGTSLKESIEGWNKATNAWLRMIAYERTKRYPTIVTYTLSAVWHGFYPGYYLTFISGAAFTFAARIMRKTIRGYFMNSNESKLLYDILTFAVTRFVLTYITFPFVLLEFWASVEVYNKLYWVIHILGALAIFAVPKLILKATPKGDPHRSGIVIALKQAGPYTDTVRHHD